MTLITGQVDLRHPALTELGLDAVAAGQRLVRSFDGGHAGHDVMRAGGPARMASPPLPA